MSNYVLTGTYTLPSLGKVYEPAINPEITLRSMTTEDEMRRLNSSERPLKVIADMIDDCMIEKSAISSYDMCLGDFQFLLHRLRVVTYGPKYKLDSTCPYCGNVNKNTIDLDDIEVFEYSEELQKYLDIDLPVCGRHIHLKMQTPRMLDDISLKAKEMRKRATSSEPVFLFSLMQAIDTIDGIKYDIIKVEDFCRHLAMKDSNCIMQTIQKLNERVGLNLELEMTCDLCGLTYESSFRQTGEFFGPSLDD